MSTADSLEDQFHNLVDAVTDRAEQKFQKHEPHVSSYAETEIVDPDDQVLQCRLELRHAMGHAVITLSYLYEDTKRVPAVYMAASYNNIVVHRFSYDPGVETAANQAEFEHAFDTTYAGLGDVITETVRFQDVVDLDEVQANTPEKRAVARFMNGIRQLLNLVTDDECQPEPLPASSILNPGLSFDS